MAPSTSERHLVENGKPKSIDLLAWVNTEVGAAWFREPDSESVSRVALGPGRTENQKLGLGTVRHPALARGLLPVDQAPAGVRVRVRVRSLADQASRYYSAEV